MVINGHPAGPGHVYRGDLIGLAAGSFTSPVAITAGVTYIAAYHSSAGNYSTTNNYFTTTVANGPLKNLANGEDGPNGLYRYTSTPAFPNSSFRAVTTGWMWYFIRQYSADLLPPQYHRYHPRTNATGVSTTVSITAVFSEALTCILCDGFLRIPACRCYIGTGYPKLYSGQYQYHPDAFFTAFCQYRIHGYAEGRDRCKQDPGCCGQCPGR